MFVSSYTHQKYMQLTTSEKTRLVMYVADTCRNRRLFRQVFRVLYRWTSGRAGLNPLCRYSCIYEARVNPSFSGSLAVQHFECGNASENAFFDSTRDCHIICICVSYDCTSLLFYPHVNIFRSSLVMVETWGRFSPRGSRSFQNLPRRSNLWRIQSVSFG